MLSYADSLKISKLDKPSVNTINKKRKKQERNNHRHRYMCVCSHVCKVALVHVQFFATLWTVTLQAPLSTRLYANKFEILHKIDTFFRKMKFSITLPKPILQANRILNKV